MPSTSAARRASRASSAVQQPRAPVRRVAGLRDSARCTPTTSCPASTARAAATAESTPPLIAARTLISAPPAAAATAPAPRARSTAAGSAVDDGGDVGLGGGVPEREPQAPSGPRRPARPSRAARGWAAARRPGRPTRSSTRCPGRRAGRAASRRRSRGTRGSQAGQPAGRVRVAVHDDVRDRAHGSPATSASRSAVSRTRVPASSLDGEPRPRRRTPGSRARRGCRCAPARSWPPPCSSGDSSAPRTATSAPTPTGPPSLWPVTVIRSRPLRAKSTGTWPTACTASECTGIPCSWAISTTSATGWTVPTSLLAHITLTSATDSRVVLDQRARRRPARPGPTASTGSQHDLGALVVREAPGRVQHRVVLDRADQHAAPARVRGAAGAVGALDREVVGLGAAGGEDHLARAGAERLRRAARGTPRRRAGPGDPRCAGTTGCRPRTSSPTIASMASGSIGVVAAWSR